MKKIFYLLTLFYLTSALGYAQSNQVKKIDSASISINKRFDLVDERFKHIEKTLDTIKDNTNDSYFTDAAKDYSFSLIYELFGYKAESGNGILQLVPIFSLFVSVVVRIFIGDKQKSLWFIWFKKLLNIIIIVLAFFVIIMPIVSFIFHRKSAETPQLIQISKSVKELDIEIEKLKSNDFNGSRKLYVDTIQLIKETQKFEIELNGDKERITGLEHTVDNLKNEIISIHNDDATSGSQTFQTLLLLAILGILCVPLIFKKK